MGSACSHLLFLETSGNQAYIYATNRLRETVGASELTARAGMHWLLEALGRGDLDPGQPVEFRKALRAQPVCPQGEEIVLATSGKAMVLVPTAERGQALIAELTRRALMEAPGLSLAGAVVPLSSRGGADAREAIRAAHERFDAHRRRMQGATLRDAVLPFVAPCESSGLPAVSGGGSADGDRRRALSAPVRAKLARADAWYRRVNAILRARGLRQVYSIDRMEQQFDSMDWLGVVYSDGNGLGQIMLSFDRWVPAGQDYFAALREFSLALDDATEAAFLDAAQDLMALLPASGSTGMDLPLPMVPLLLGGDDLTVLVHGRYALPFARRFLLAFEAHSGGHPAIARIAERALGAPRLSAGAGVAIVKPHYPYHSAHGLADGLLRSAKEAKRRVQRNGQPFPCSALDVHVLFDAAQTDLGQLREARRRAADGARLWGGPYVVSPLDHLAVADAEGRAWAQDHHLDALLSRLAVLKATKDGRPCLPTSQTHALREALAAGKGVADAAVRERSHLLERGLAELLEPGESLFRCAGHSAETDTRFLDAITVADFWPVRQGDDE